METRDLGDWDVPADGPLVIGQAGLFTLGAEVPTHVATVVGEAEVSASTEPGSGERFALGGDRLGHREGPRAHRVTLVGELGEVWAIGTEGGEHVAVKVRGL